MRSLPILCAVLLSTFGALAACGGTRDAHLPTSVVLMVVDTLRADRTATYGHEAANSPHLDELAERGVRFTQVFIRQWDQHGNLPNDIRRQCGIIDQPCYALVQDLKERGLLEDTLVVWGR